MDSPAAGFDAASAADQAMTLSLVGVTVTTAPPDSVTMSV